uniref:Uncharacterized protein n=1 Tax=Arundo donax TaxID=35708 RepID=A0A0A9C289_ARUDO
MQTETHGFRSNCSDGTVSKKVNNLQDDQEFSLLHHQEIYHLMA